MNGRTLMASALAAGLLCAVPARAEHTRFWRQSDYNEFERGTAKGVAMRSDGKLVPAPRFEQYSDPNLAYLWALRTDSKGRLYAAGGSDAKVLRFDDPTKPTTVFESKELAAQALAFDARDNLYVATSPDGRVYKVTPDGKSAVFFEPKTKYIWALAFDANGTLFVATGDEGKVFAVDADGKGQIFYKSDETHARSLTVDAGGNVLIGTEPNGLVIRVEKIRKTGATLPEAGAAFVLYETAKKEVTALATDRAGNIYAAAIGEKPRATGVTSAAPTGIAGAIPSSITVPGVPAPQITVTSQVQITPGTTSFMPFPAITGGGEVYRIAVDGSPESLWNSREETVYSLGFSPTGKLLLGTGNHGAIIELEGDGIFSSLAKAASEQVTNLIPGAGGGLYVATANPGKIFRLGPGNQAEGSYLSQTFDARIFSQWGRLTWWGDNGANSGKVSFYVRSGNSANPEKSWSAWAGPYVNAAGEKVGCPPARFAQWKAVFHSGESSAPEVSWVKLAYLPKNVAPVIDAIIVQDPGIRAQGIIVPPTQGPVAVTPVPLHLPQANPAAAAAAAVAAAATQEFQSKVKQQIPMQGFAQKGWQTVVWAAHDENDDELVFAIYYRGEGERNWRLLKDKIDQRFYSWDTTSMPDGAYILKVVASDSPANPPDQTLTAERESERFEVDNTPPEVRNLHVEPAGVDVRVQFEANDAASVIARVAYSLDAGEWEIVFPVGSLTDAPQERYDFLLRNLAPGEHTLAVQAFDHVENSATAKVTFTIAARSAR